MRAFLALPISAEAEQQLAAVSAQLRQRYYPVSDTEQPLRWIPPSNYHLTLMFLGKIELREVEALNLICQRLAADYPVDRLCFSAVDWFPSALKPRMIVALPEPNKTLFALQKQLLSYLRRDGFSIEEREFRPHISLARCNKGVSQPVDFSTESMQVTSALDEIVLYKSTASKAGVIYSPLFAEPIGAKL